MSIKTHNVPFTLPHRLFVLLTDRAEELDVSLQELIIDSVESQMTGEDEYGEDGFYKLHTFLDDDTYTNVMQLADERGETDSDVIARCVEKYFRDQKAANIISAATEQPTADDIKDVVYSMLEQDEETFDLISDIIYGELKRLGVKMPK